eukprot:3112822-Pyramimonas_sp.AAC.1
MFQYATQSPQFMSVSPLTSVAAYAPTGDPSDERWGGAHLECPRYRYSFTLEHDENADDVLCCDIKEVRVLE